MNAFTTRIHSVKHLNSWDHLKVLNLYSQEHKQDRYIAIYTWKILEGLVPNLHTEVRPHETRRYGKMCKIAPLMSRGEVGMLRENSINTKGPRLFNNLPIHIRGHNWLTNRSIQRERDLNKHLQRIPY